MYALNMPANRPRGREILSVPAVFEDSQFLGNTAGGGGGAIYVDQGVTCELNGVSFRGNAIGTLEVPIGSRATPDRLFDGASVMADSEAPDNRAALRFGDKACSFKNNASFATQVQRSLLPSPIVALFLGRNVDAEQHDEVEDVVNVEESPLPLSCYRKQRAERMIDTAVIHHISAIKWFGEDFQRRLPGATDASDLVDRLAPKKETLEELKYRWEACKAILQVYRLSSHYLIARDGRIIRLVHENDLGMHAGNSVMPPPDGRPDVNQFSVGIEFVASHPDDDPSVANGSTPAYTEEQYLALERLLDVVYRRCAAPEFSAGLMVVGHNEIATLDVRGIAGAKKDPGPAFAWDRVRDEQKRMRLNHKVPRTIAN